MILNCPKCSAPILKGLEDLSNGSGGFTCEMKCPHCQYGIKIEFYYQLMVMVNGETYANGKKLENFAKSKVVEDAKQKIRFIN